MRTLLCVPGEIIESCLATSMSDCQLSELSGGSHLRPDLCRLLLHQFATHGSLNTMQVCVSHAIACLALSELAVQVAAGLITLLQ